MPASQLMTVGEKNMLMNELLGARRRWTFFREGDVGCRREMRRRRRVSKRRRRREGATEVTTTSTDGRNEGERVLNSAPLARRDAAAFSARERARPWRGRDGGGGSGDSNTSGGGGGGGGLLDRVVVTAAAELVDATRRRENPANRAPSSRHFRNGLGCLSQPRDRARSAAPVKIAPGGQR